jgi:hypothetical protein
MKMTAKAKYSSLANKRKTVSDRAETFAQWTIPSIYPDSTDTDNDELVNSFNSIGAEAVNNLTNKLLVALFSPTRPFFRIELERTARQKVMDDMGFQSETQLDSLLSQIEQEGMRVLTKRNIRISTFQLIQQLIVTGNSLLFYPPDSDNLVVYSLRDYVVERCQYGKVKLIIIKETKTFGSLSDENKAIASKSKAYKEDDVVDFYTMIQKTKQKKFEVTQYLEETELTTEGTKGIYPEDKLPYIVLTWRLARNRSYGTGLVEEYAGDFHAVTVLNESFVKGLADMADLKKLVNPSGLTDIEDLVRSEFGAYVQGRADDITIPQSNKSADYQIVDKGIEGFTRRIARAFLLGSAVVRDSERTTALEVQQQANELETSLGGVYSRLAEDLQAPLASLAMLEINTELSKSNGVTPMIITGMEAISRFKDMDNFKMWLSDLALTQQLPPEILQRLDINAIGEYSAAARGLEAGKFVKSEEQVQAEQQAMMQQQMSQEQQMQQSQAQAQAQAKGVNNG